VEAMLTVSSHKITGKVAAVNIGPSDRGVNVRWIAEQVIARVSPGAKIVFGLGNKGWVGDVPSFNYSTKLISSYGWSPTLSSADAISLAINEIADQQGC